MTAETVEESDPSEGATADATIGAAIAHLRSAAGMSQQDLSERMRDLGWKWLQPTVWSIEKGKRPLRLAESVDLAGILETPIEDLFRESASLPSDRPTKSIGAPNDVAIGRLIASQRREAGMTQDNLATTMREKAHPWTQADVAKIELGRRKVNLVEARDLADALEVQVMSLFTTPIERALTDIHVARMKAQQTLSGTESRFQVLQALAAAIDGESASLGPQPAKALLQAFHPPRYPWPRTRELFEFLGVPPGTLDELSTLVRSHDSSGFNRLPAFPKKLGESMFTALQSALPTLTSDSE